MERYNEYKDSGVQWLGVLPSHWKMLRLRFACDFRTGYTPSKDNPKFWVNGSIPWYRMEDIRTSGRFLTEAKQYVSLEAVKKGGIFEAGSFILATTATIGEHAQLIVDSLANQQFTNLKIRKSLVDRISTQYFFYYLFVVDDFCKNSTKISTFPAVVIQDLKNVTVCIPTYIEQQAIAAYLDNITSKIDVAITQQQKMIDLLNERKQIIINHSVTKGLNPNAKMKDSGIDWIGDIPEGWEVRRGKFLFKIVNELSATGTEELLTVSDRTGITPRSMKNVTMFMAESLVGYKKCSVGDICSNIMWMWHGAVGVTKYDGVISPSYGVYRQLGNYFDSDYLDLLLRLPKLVKLYASFSTGLTESRLRLYPTDFMNIFFFVPTLKEQTDIMQYLKQICNPIDSAIEAANKQISLLQERKQIIINEVVTGKVKVS